MSIICENKGITPVAIYYYMNSSKIMLVLIKEAIVFYLTHK
jgi:hypothetical protein